MSYTGNSVSDKIIVVTGVNGYIASHIALQFAQKGYIVRGTSRNPATEEQLRQLFIENGLSPDQYQHFVVPSITDKGAFDAAVAGAHSIIHVASPIDLSLPDLDSFLVPAVKGVEEVLRSAVHHAGPQLKSFVYTSSVAAVSDRFKHPPPSTYAYTEADWNENSLRVARENFQPFVAYGASKTLAERALWAFRDDNRPHFAISATNAGVVIGPPVLWPKDPSKLNVSLMPTWALFAGLSKEVPPAIGGGSYIDVRDAAAVHVWAALHPEESDGQRYLLTNGSAPFQATADILRKQYPDRDIAVGEPGKGYDPKTFWFLDTETSAVATKAYKALGVERFTLFDKSLIETVEAMQKRWPHAAKNFK